MDETLTAVILTGSQKRFLVLYALVSANVVKLSTVAMACRFELVLEGDEPIRLRSAGEEALSEIERLDAQLSRFRPGSDISWINAHASAGPVKVEPLLFGLLELACKLSNATDRAFDITVGSLMRLWGFGESNYNVPSALEIAETCRLVGVEHIILDSRTHTVRFDLPGVEIDLGAIGKGYAVDRAVELLRSAGIRRALLHGGTSTAFALGEWKVGIAKARAANDDEDVVESIVLRDCALSVSAPHGRLFESEGHRYGHVIDPRTGMPVAHTGLAAVWGPSATYCDVLSTALLILGNDWISQMKSRFPGYDGLTVPPG
ncbi:MAG: FAD:protein FMN transferase [Armatimonadota bacterium]|nr:FAD:protein FMN transferase [Armatimonadota bacterium]